MGKPGGVKIMFILDLGSGNTCKNNYDTIFRMIKSLSEIDPERKFILKWQLFKKAGENIPLLPAMFLQAYRIAKGLGYKTTASVFDKESLDYLLQYNIPFVKIANRSDLYWLIGEVPRKISVVVSTGNSKQANDFAWTPILEYMCCISNYPTDLKDYENTFPKKDLSRGISDHTTNWDLFRKYKPKIYERHFKLEDSTGPDAGPFARTPDQLKEIYNEI